MKVITEPTVFPVLVPFFVADQSTYQLPVSPDATHSEKGIAFAGKVCYDSYGAEGRSIDEHIVNLIKSNHGSVLEHANISLFIGGISRGCSHEIVRHRAGFAYSQRSTRYTNEDDAALVLEPMIAQLFEKWQFSRNAEGRWWSHKWSEAITTKQDKVEFDMVTLYINNFRDNLADYLAAIKMLEELNPDNLKGVGLRKYVRGKARQLLAHGLETRMVMTGNLRSWRHFVEMRSDPAAEAEIRRLSNHIYATIHQFAPSVFKDYIAVKRGGFMHYIPGSKKV